jgi:hypothetical protein
MKDKLVESDIFFVERDINEHKDEYDMFVEITENDFVPAFMIVETTDESAKLFAPDRDFQDINEAFEIIKQQIIL